MTRIVGIHGLMIACDTPQAILLATREAWRAGYRQMDAYTPYPVRGLAVALGMKHSCIPAVVLVGGIVGASVGFFMQYYSMAVDYPFNVGGRPHNSWPVFVPIAFELLVLVASFSAVFGMMFVCGLPRPHHPVFNIPDFVRASQDRFFLCIEATDPQFELHETTVFLAALVPGTTVIEVPE
ncbi:MAG TPA: DUF3341 domain-containing protein [Pirellulales bacterium]|jgi:hypothetical protein|nr:DUF3341 domain-containing protein [Pirellulales bacterium]